MIDKLMFYESIFILGCLLYLKTNKWLDDWKNRQAFDRVDTWRKKKEEALSELLQNVRVIVEGEYLEVLSFDGLYDNLTLRSGMRVKTTEAEIVYTCSRAKFDYLCNIIKDNEYQINHWLQERFSNI